MNELLEFLDSFEYDSQGNPKMLFDEQTGLEYSLVEASSLNQRVTVPVNEYAAPALRFLGYDYQTVRKALKAANGSKGGYDAMALRFVNRTITEKVNELSPSSYDKYLTLALSGYLKEVPNE